MRPFAPPVDPHDPTALAVARGSASTLVTRHPHRGGPSQPQRIGRYLVLDVLGSGGMGTVLTAYDEQLDRRVALKLLHQEVAVHHSQRLLREAQALAKVSHPNVVGVYEVGQIDGRTFIAMEMVRGQSLMRWQYERARSWRECVTVYGQAGLGLSAVHSAGLVHRDFKPSNCVIDEAGRVRVLDFGLVRGLDGANGPASPSTWRHLEPRFDALDASLTRTGAVLGTFAYMPLEQISGHTADALSDQFSFCVSLYEALYGERPFAGVNVAALTAALVAGRIRPPPKGRRVPGRLRRLLLRGLARNPRQRWPSMDALLTELRAVLRPNRTGLLAIGVVLAVALPLVRWTVDMPEPGEAPAPAVDAESIIDTHVQAARAAAAKAAYLHPPADDPAARTAYLEVVTLESRAEELGERAVEAASQLRLEFAHTLVQLGDRYWDQPGGRPFARDHYVAALVFDPSQPRARERTSLTSDALTKLQQQATLPTPAIPEGHLAAAESIPIPTQPSPDGPSAGVVDERTLPKPAVAHELEPARPKPTPAPERAKVPMLESTPSASALSTFLRAMESVHSLAKACGQRSDAPKGDKVVVSVTIDGLTGEVIRVKPIHNHINSPLGRCVANVVSHNVRYIKKLDQPVVSYSYIFHM